MQHETHLLNELHAARFTGDTPEYDPSKPHQFYPKEVYDLMLGTPDEALTQAASETTPPGLASTSK